MAMELCVSVWPKPTMALIHLSGDPKRHPGHSTEGVDPQQE